MIEKIKKVDSGLTAIQIKLGWVLSGPVEEESPHVTHTSNLTTIHTLKCTSKKVQCKK